MKPGAHAAPLSQMPAGPDVKSGHRLLDFVSLTKPRLNLLVLLTTLGGLYIASPTGVATSTARSEAAKKAAATRAANKAAAAAAGAGE